MSLYTMAGQVALNKRDTENIDNFYNMVFGDMPTVKIPTKELTKRIRKFLPNYQFDEGTAEDRREREQTSQDARMAIAKAAINQRYGGKNERWTALRPGDRGLPSAINTYRTKYLSGSTELDIDHRNFPGYDATKRAVIENLVERADQLISDYNKKSNKELVESAEELYALWALSDTETSIAKDEQWSEEERQAYVLKLNPLATMCSKMIAKLEMIASPLGTMLNTEEVLNLSQKQLGDLYWATTDIYTGGNEDKRDMYHPFGANGIVSCNNAIRQELIDKYKDSAGLSVLIKNGDIGLECFDLCGDHVGETDVDHVCMSDGMPVLFGSVKNPEIDPIPGFIYQGKTYIGDDALAAYHAHGKKQIPLPEQPVYDPNPFKWFWDKIVEIFGFSSDRMLHEEAMVDYHTLADPIQAKNEKLQSFMSNFNDSMSALKTSIKTKLEEKKANDKEDNLFDWLNKDKKDEKKDEAQLQNDNELLEVFEETAQYGNLFQRRSDAELYAQNAEEEYFERESRLSSIDKAKAGTQNLYDKRLVEFSNKLKALGEDYEEFRQTAEEYAENDYLWNFGFSETGKLLTGLSGDMLKSLGDLYNRKENFSLEEMLNMTMGNNANPALGQSEPKLQKSGSMQKGGPG